MDARTSFVSLVLAAGIVGSAPRPAATPLPAAPAASAPAAGDEHEDPRFGYSIQPPKDWTEIPVQVEEGWLIAKFLSKKINVYNDKEGWTWEHKPEMLVLAFVAEAAKKSGAEAEKSGDKTVVTFVNRYKDYLDYLKKTYSGGGYYVSKEEQVKVGEVAATAYEIKVEKGSYNGPKRIITWVFHVPGVNIAVHFEILEDASDKLAPVIKRTLKSFKQIPRTSALPTDQASGVKAAIQRIDEDELTPDERRQRRMEHELSAHTKAIDALPEGWTHERMGRFLVLDHAGGNYAKKLVEHGTAVLGWLEQTFDFVGPGEYVRSPILRICKDQDEENSYSRGSGQWSWNDLEIVANRDENNWDSVRFDWTGSRLVDLWFQDRDRGLRWAMPFWLSNGLSRLVANSDSKGGKLVFKSDWWANDELREMVREGRAIKPRELVMLTNTEVMEGAGTNFWDQWRQSEAFVYFLVAGDGARDRELRTIVPGYMRNLHLLVEHKKQQERKDGDGEKKAEPKTEAEEEALYKKRMEEWKKREKEVLEEVFQMTFGAWDEPRWKRVEKAYFKAIG